MHLAPLKLKIYYVYAIILFCNQVLMVLQTGIQNTDLKYIYGFLSSIFVCPKCRATLNTKNIDLSVFGLACTFNFQYFFMQGPVFPDLLFDL